MLLHFKSQGARWCNTGFEGGEPRNAMLRRLLVQITMFLKIATFTGQIEHVVAAAVALFCVCDLDEKILQSEAQLKAKYARGISQLTEDRGSRPACMMRSAMLVVVFLRMMVPAALVAIALIAWKRRETD